MSFNPQDELETIENRLILCDLLRTMVVEFLRFPYGYRTSVYERLKRLEIENV